MVAGNVKMECFRVLPRIKRGRSYTWSPGEANELAYVDMDSFPLEFTISSL